MAFKTLLPLCFVFFMSVFSVSRADVLRIATGEFAPYCSSFSRHEGFANHLVKEAFARQGYPVSYSYFPWKRAYEMTRSGEFDASSWWAKSDDRA